LGRVLHIAWSYQSATAGRSVDRTEQLKRIVLVRPPRQRCPPGMVARKALRSGESYRDNKTCVCCRL
jgi:hypothetical protein